MNGLDLFSGIGGNTLGLRRYIKTVAYCEADRHAQSVLLSRMADASIESAPIWDDITTLKGSMFDVPVDIIVGGFPCTDISTAGRGEGLEGKRSGLFYELCRLVEEIKPPFVFLENVPAIRTRGLREVVRAFTDMGYDCRWTCVSAAEVGAPHIRKRWFLLANANNGYRGQLRHVPKKNEVERRPEKQFENAPQQSGNASCNASILADATDPNREKLSREFWEVEPDVGRVVNGVPQRLDRIKRIGNAVVPLQAKTAFERLMGWWVEHDGVLIRLDEY